MNVFALLLLLAAIFPNLFCTIHMHPVYIRIRIRVRVRVGLLVLYWLKM